MYVVLLLTPLLLQKCIKFFPISHPPPFKSYPFQPLAYNFKPALFIFLITQFCIHLLRLISSVMCLYSQSAGIPQSLNQKFLPFLFHHPHNTSCLKHPSVFLNNHNWPQGSCKELRFNADYFIVHILYRVLKSNGKQGFIIFRLSRSLKIAPSYFLN